MIPKKVALNQNFEVSGVHPPETPHRVNLENGVKETDLIFTGKIIKSTCYNSFSQILVTDSELWLKGMTHLGEFKI